MTDLEWKIGSTKFRHLCVQCKGEHTVNLLRIDYVSNLLQCNICYFRKLELDDRVKLRSIAQGSNTFVNSTSLKLSLDLYIKGLIKKNKFVPHIGS